MIYIYIAQLGFQGISVAQACVAFPGATQVEEWTGELQWLRGQGLLDETESC